MSVYLKLITPLKEIEKLILEEIKNIINSALYQSKFTIKSLFTPELEKQMYNSDEYHSLKSSVLRGELGVIDAEITTRAIVEFIIERLTITIVPMEIRGSELNGGIKIVFLREQDAEDLFEQMSFMSEGSLKFNRPPAKVDWLRWLLTKGTEVVVENMVFKPWPYNPPSRTGLGIMRYSKRNWSVPPEFAGTKDDNWITRALIQAGPVWADILIDNINKEL